MTINKRLEVTIYNCPECDKKLEAQQEECEYCGSPLSWSEKESGLHVRIDVYMGGEDDVIDTESGKPIARVTGYSGNTLKTLSICARALEKNGLSTKAEEMKNRVFEAESYDNALSIMCEYVVLA